MEMKQSLATTKQKQSNVVEYDSNGTTVSLSFDTIRRYLVNGGGNVSDQDVIMFMGMCQANKLNPFNREAYLIKYGNNSPATMVTGKDVFLKRAQKNPDFDGLQAGIILIEIETGQMIEREGTFYIPEEERLVGGWCKVYQKSKKIPSYESVSFNEYVGRKKDGTINEQWQKRPATMIRKVALVHALKEAFPQDLGGMYAQEEIPEAQGIILDEAPIPAPQVVEAPVYEQAVQAYQEPAYEQAAFFPGDAAQPSPYGANNAAVASDEFSDPAAALFRN